MEGTQTGPVVTVQDIDGIQIDLNRVTRREFHELMGEIAAAQMAAKGLEADQHTGVLIERVVVDWPYEVSITTDSYMDLPMHDAQRVDNALEQAIRMLQKKR